MSIKMDKVAFYRRMSRLYEAWKDDEELQKLDALACIVGTDQDVVYSKSTQMQIWLFGYELSDTLMVCAEKAIYFLASKKKIEFLRQIESNMDQNVPPIKLLIRDKSDNDKNNFEKLSEAIKDSKKGKTLGVFEKDNSNTNNGAFCDAWKKVLDKCQVKDMSHPLALIMATKEDSELNTIKKACQVTVDVFSKYVKEQVMDIIDSDKKVKHSKMAEGIENAVSDKKYIGDKDKDQLDLCYPPIVQSGGNYKLKFSHQSDKENIHFGAIICTFGARYKQYCSNIARTFLVNPSEKIQSIYNMLVSLEEHILTELKDGAKCSDIYKSAVSFVKKESPELVDKLTKNFGFVMGIEFRESTLSITPSCDAVVRKGMVFNINIGLTGLTNKEASDSKGRDVALFIGDTVVVSDDGAANILTPSKKKIKNIAIFLKDADSSAEEVEVPDTLPDPESFGRGRRTAVLDQKLRQDSTAEEKRKSHQRELMERMNEEALRRIKEGGGAKAETKARKPPVSYKSNGQLPREPEVKQLKIYVDKKYETIILPVFGVPVPFHIATVKNISTSIEGDYTYLRINFYHPGAAVGKDGFRYATPPEATFLKELTYRSTNVKEPGEIHPPSANLNAAFKYIKDIQKKFKDKENEEKEKADLVQQDKLIMSQGKGNPKLKDLYIRPNIVQKRLSGTLEAHVNGFMYTSIRGDKIEILYNNIKHAFYQNCDGEMIILLHFHLRNAIIIGKKKQVDIQFYTEVGEITTDLGKHQHMHDRDDLAAEQAERELRHKLKSAFRTFCEKVESATKGRGDVEFDCPFRKLGFHGVPYRETVLLQPTTGCLITLSQWPPFVVSLEDLELVHFERVQFQLKNFDMVFIFKDYNRKTQIVGSIPMNMLDNVKDWLNSVDIRYTEGVQSLNWTKIMKTITDDPEVFFEDGGWNFLDQGADDEPEDDDDDDSEDAEFAVSEDSDGSGSDDSEDDYSSEDVSEDDESGGLDSDESEGKDWSDLEREAAEDDDDDDDDRDRGRHGRGGGGRGHSSHHKSSKHSSPAKKSSHHRDRDHKSSRDHRDGKRKREQSSSSSKHHKSPKKHRR